MIDQRMNCQMMNRYYPHIASMQQAVVNVKCAETKAQIQFQNAELLLRIYALKHQYFPTQTTRKYH